MRVGRALEHLTRAEVELADEYEKVGQRQAAEHDVYHTCLTLQRQCLDHVAEIARHAERFGADAADPHEGPEVWGSLVGGMRHRISELVARRPASGLLLMRDLRQLYHMAHEVSSRGRRSARLRRRCATSRFSRRRRGCTSRR